MRIFYILLCISASMRGMNSETEISSDSTRSQHANTTNNSIAREFYTLAHNPNTIAKRNNFLFTTLHKYLNPDKHPETKDKFREEIQQYGVPTVMHRHQKQAQDTLTTWTNLIPLSCLFECYSYTCPISRSNSTLREKFERTVAQRITECNADHIHYASIASGYLLPDARIITLALSQMEDAHITIHCIDLWFQHNNPYTHKIEQHSEPIEHEEALSAPTYTHVPGITASKELNYDMHLCGNPKSQPHYLLYMLRYMFPSKRINMILYTSTNQYLEFIKGRKANTTYYYTQPPHVIGACDLESASTVQDIFDETMQMLNRNYTAKACYLMGCHGKAKLSEFSYTHVPDGKEYRVNVLRRHVAGEEALSQERPGTETVYARIEKN